MAGSVTLIAEDSGHGDRRVTSSATKHAFIHAMKDLMDGIKTGKSPAPAFERSAGTGGWARPGNGGFRFG